VLPTHKTLDPLGDSCAAAGRDLTGLTNDEQ
jgi:hypothetical protein